MKAQDLERRADELLEKAHENVVKRKHDESVAAERLYVRQLMNQETGIWADERKNNGAALIPNVDRADASLKVFDNYDEIMSRPAPQGTLDIPWEPDYPRLLRNRKVRSIYLSGVLVIYHAVTLVSNVFVRHINRVLGLPKNVDAVSK